jgi:pimeloyl-ACP methyl ester carboxylesterase
MMNALSPGLRWFSFGVSPDPEAVRLTADMIGRARLTAIGGFRSWVSTHDRVEALAAMRGLPAAVLVGTHDRLTPRACFDTIVAALPDAEHVVCPHAGHILPLERPDEVTGAIARICHQAATVQATGEPVRSGVRARIGALAREIVPKGRRVRARPRATRADRAA